MKNNRFLLQILIIGSLNLASLAHAGEKVKPGKIIGGAAMSLFGGLAVVTPFHRGLSDNSWIVEEMNLGTMKRIGSWRFVQGEGFDRNAARMESELSQAFERLHKKGKLKELYVSLIHYKAQDNRVSSRTPYTRLDMPSQFSPSPALPKEMAAGAVGRMRHLWESWETIGEFSVLRHTKKIPYGALACATVGAGLLFLGVRSIWRGLFPKGE